jgi:hypothetical protein
LIPLDDHQVVAMLAAHLLSQAVLHQQGIPGGDDAGQITAEAAHAQRDSPRDADVMDASTGCPH